MIILEDTRQQDGKHEGKHNWFTVNHIEVVRCKLPFGDYTALGNVYVDTKASISEMAQNIGGGTKEHTRFRNELILASKFGKHLYILVENNDGISHLSEVAGWNNPRLKTCGKAITGERLMKAANTMQHKYGCSFVFCEPERAAEAIIRLIERDT